MDKPPTWFPGARDLALGRATGVWIPWLRALIACLVVPAMACTTWVGSAASVRITPDELLAGASLEVADVSASLVPEKDVLALSSEMRDFLDKHVDRKASAPLKLHQLAFAIIDTEKLGVKYDDTTRTAPETFHLKHGNCLSYSNMFIAMARDVGLKVQFQEVDIPPDWTFDNDTFVLNRHVNVYVNLGLMGTRVVDFNMEDFKSTYDMLRISDERALGHFYNNIGVERMQAGDKASALAHFRRAIVDSGQKFSPPWTNLGTLYLRNGHPAHAEAAFLEALKVNGSDSVAMSNLARLYERLGDRERAAAYKKRVYHDHWHNPYYRYELAHEAYLARDYDTAITHLKYAIWKRPAEDTFYFLMGISYLGKGDALAARRWLARAEAVAATDVLRRRYASKVDALLRGGR
ncbi:MAG: tetratricopeptide repeat protein [Acidobacteriia bacterium]|nr:tetratricopeptide repeat protein [Terriglobia bacterium]